MLLKELRSQTESIETSLEGNKKGIAELEQEKENLTRENAELRAQDNELKNQNRRLEMVNQELVEKGVDDPIIKKMRGFDHEDRTELVERIDTYDNYIKLQEEIQTLRDTKETVTSQIEKSNATISSQEEKVSSLTEEIKKHEDGFEKVGKIADIANLAVQYGYSPNTFESLLNTIENYLDLTPYTTNTRVFEAFQEYQSLEQIRAETIRATRENEAVKEQLERTKGDLSAIRDDVLNAIRSVGQESRRALDAQRTEAERRLRLLDQQQGQILDKNEERIQNQWNILEKKTKLWEEKLKEIGKYEELLKHSLVLSTSFYNPVYARNIGQSDILLLAQVLDSWVQHHMNGVNAYPPPEIKRFKGFNSSLLFSIPGLSRFLLSELTRRAT